MERTDIEKTVYDKNVIDFVTIAVEICLFLEKNESQSRGEWIDRILKMLPLLYVKALLLPDTNIPEEDPPAGFVQEEDYWRVTQSVVDKMGDEDDYLDVFTDEMKYSDTPVIMHVSEDIADIYQDIRNFVTVYQYGVSERMNDALWQCKMNFIHFWGQKLVNVMRPLHALKCDDMLTEEFNQELTWD